MRHIVYGWVYLLALLFPVSARSATTELLPGGTREYVGTTPCGELAREFLQIGKTAPCDKITWRLTLFDGGTNAYKLVATFGLQEQSAPGFMERGTTEILEGKVETVAVAGTQLKAGIRIYEIKSEKTKRSLSLMTVNDDLLHLLDGDNRLMIGNEFWSYTLNRKGAGRDR